MGRNTGTTKRLANNRRDQTRKSCRTKTGPRPPIPDLSRILSLSSSFSIFSILFFFFFFLFSTSHLRPRPTSSTFHPSWTHASRVIFRSPPLINAINDLSRLILGQRSARVLFQRADRVRIFDTRVSACVYACVSSTPIVFYEVRREGREFLFRWTESESRFRGKRKRRGEFDSLFCVIE